MPIVGACTRLHPLLHYRMEGGIPRSFQPLRMHPQTSCRLAPLPALLPSCGTALLPIDPPTHPALTAHGPPLPQEGNEDRNRL